MNLFKRLVHEEHGQTMVEYGLLVFLISIAAIAVLPGVGTAITNTFSQVGAALGA